MWACFTISDSEGRILGLSKAKGCKGIVERYVRKLGLRQKSFIKI